MKTLTVSRIQKENQIITPILRWDDMETLQEVVRALRKAGEKTGAAIGSFFCPGIGTAIGGLLGVLSGAATGAVAGNTVGKLIDENVFRIWRCESCGYEWRAA